MSEKYRSPDDEVDHGFELVAPEFDEQVQDQLVEPDELADSAVDALEAVVLSVVQSKELRGLRDKIEALVHGSASRADIASGLIDANNLSRLAKHAAARRNLERIILAEANKPEMDLGKAAVLFKLVNEVTTDLEGTVKTRTTEIKDVAGALGKADAVLSSSRADALKKFATTTPQGREIIRRLSHTVNKAARKAGGEGVKG